MFVIVSVYHTEHVDIFMIYQPYHMLHGSSVIVITLLSGYHVLCLNARIWII